MPAMKPKSQQRTVYTFHKKNVWLIRKRLTMPNGYPAELDVIVHPGAVVIVPFISPREVLLLRQYRPSLEKYLWEFPAGTMNKGESPLVSAKRELQEETGYKAGRIRQIGRIYPVPGYSTERMVIYKAQDLKPRFLAGDPDEVIEVRTFTTARVREMVKKGQIIDAKTICALVFAGVRV